MANRSVRTQMALSEQANLPAYVFVKNSPVNSYDALGLFDPTAFRWYGNWCGGGWTGGQHEDAGDYDWENDPRPAVVDGLDNCCRIHDACYANWDLVNKRKLPGVADKKKCDKGLCECSQRNFTLANSKANLGIQCIFCEKPVAEPPRGQKDSCGVCTIFQIKF